MQLAEYAAYDALGLAGLVARGEVSARELADTARRAIEAVNPRLNAIVEIYREQLEALDEETLGYGPFRGVPFLIKDVFGHLAGRRIEWGSRLCRGMTADADTYAGELFRASGLNIIGRSATPEYSMSSATETVLYGNASNPWRDGYSPGGSTGGGMAAVMAGIVPIAHGSDIAGSIRNPASWCGGVGLKPSRGRISFGPQLDENGFGLATTFVQTKTVRDAAAMLDFMAQPRPGDPFRIPKPVEPYAALIGRAPASCQIGFSLSPLMGIEVDPEVARAVKNAASLLAEMGHTVEEVTPDYDGLKAARHFIDVWFFGFDLRAQGYARRTEQKIGPETLEPVVLAIYEYAQTITPERFLNSMSVLNSVRRKLGQVYQTFDVWLTPTTPRVAEPVGRYGLGRPDVTIDTLAAEIYAVPFQYTLPHNILGTPAISLPLDMHSSGLPIGVQLGTRHADEQVILGVAAALEAACPWRDRIPLLHVTRLS
jgi:amidase